MLGKKVLARTSLVHKSEEELSRACPRVGIAAEECFGGVGYSRQEVPEVEVAGLFQEPGDVDEKVVDE